MSARPSTTRFAVQNAAVVAASLVVPVPILAATTVEAILDSTNPMQLDVTQDFAYFDAMVAWGFGSLALMLVIVGALFALVYRRHHDLRALGLPIAILSLQLLMWVIILLVGNVTNDAESAYNRLS